MPRHCVAALAKGITIVCVLASGAETSCDHCTRKYQIEGVLAINCREYKNIELSFHSKVEFISMTQLCTGSKNATTAD
jgi:hypothetical protein